MDGPKKMAARGETADTMKITFWVNEPNLHLAPLCRRFARLGDDVVVVTEFALPAARQKLGWAQPDYGDAQVFVAPSSVTRREIEEARVGGVHFFTGL